VVYLVVYCLIINEVIILQFLISLTLFFFNFSINIITTWYLAGIYLFSLGFFLLLDDCDIFIGFLWVVDLGVGLIFFIFILHFSNFLLFKVLLDINAKLLFIVTLIFFFILIFLYVFALPTDINFNYTLMKTWFFTITHYDYYPLYNNLGLIDLNVAREVYFYSNSFEFFIINFVVFLGIIAAILTAFFIKRILLFSNIGLFLNTDFYSTINSVFFIRNQNFMKQKTTSAGTRVWYKSKSLGDDTKTNMN
jgi:hypothetical protein